MLENSVPIMSFKRFIAKSAQANWIAIKKTYSDGDSLATMSTHANFTGPITWTNTTKHIQCSTQHAHEELCKNYRDAKGMEEENIKDHVIRAW